MPIPPWLGVRTAAVALTVAASLLPALVADVPAASAACATPTSRSISGTIVGSDNLDVNVSLGFDVESSTGMIIDATPGTPTYGCRKTGGYSTRQLEVNRYLSADGAPAGTAMHDYTGAYMGNTTRTWRLSNLPSNARSVWIEVYSRRYRNTGCRDAQGNLCMGPSDTHKYGYVMRRQVPVGTTGVPLRLPRNCGYTGGANGAIAGTVRTRSGVAVRPSNAFAWSTAPNGSVTVFGWGSGVPSQGGYRISALASKQAYAVWVMYNGVTQKRTGVMVNACRTTPLNFVF